MRRPPPRVRGPITGKMTEMPQFCRPYNYQFLLGVPIRQEFVALVAFVPCLHVLLTRPTCLSWASPCPGALLFRPTIIRFDRSIYYAQHEWGLAVACGTPPIPHRIVA